MTFILAAVGLMALAIVAAARPAWRATRIDPVRSLAGS
jgi:ABC-type lipoprotein release transport system permease subunit